MRATIKQCHGPPVFTVHPNHFSPLCSLSVFVCLLHWVLVCLPAVQGRDPPGCTWIIQEPVDHLSISCLVFKLRPVSVRDTERIGHLDPSSHWILYILDFSTEHFKKDFIYCAAPTLYINSLNLHSWVLHLSSARQTVTNRIFKQKCFLLFQM